MNNGDKKSLTKRDAVDIMCLKIRWVARHIEHGTIELRGTQQSGVPVLQVVNGEVKQCDIDIHPIERFRGNNKPITK